NVQQVDSAQTPEGPSAPKPMRNAALAGVLALIVGVALALLLDRLDDRIKTPADVGEALGDDVAILGALPIYAPKKPRGATKLSEGPRTLVPSSSIDAEVYRTIRSNVRFSGFARTKNVIMVTSASSGEGKSTVTANLAVALAEDGLRVVVIS